MLQGWDKVPRLLLLALTTTAFVGCGMGLNSIQVKTATETAAENCEARRKCIKDPKGLVLYNPDLVTDNLIVKQPSPTEPSPTLLNGIMNLIDEPKLLVISEKFEPHMLGIALVGELERCDSPRGIDGTNPTLGKLRQLKEGRYKACLVYLGEGYLKRIIALDPIEVDTTPPEVAGGVTVTGITYNGGILSWSKAGDNLTLDGQLTYLVYLSTVQALSSLENIQKFGSRQPGEVKGVSSYLLNSLTEKTVYHAAVVARDEAGNETLVGSANFLTPSSDATAPTVTITSNRDPGPTNLTSILLTFQFSEAVSGFDASDVQLSGGTKGSFSAIDGDTYTLAVTATGSTVSAVVGLAAAQDEAGNKSVASSMWSLTINGAASAPVATPSAGIYTSSQSVTLSSSTPGANIYYSVDSSTPTTASTPYSSPLSVSSNQTIKAIAVAPNHDNSAVSSFAYTITGTVQTPTFSVSAGAYGPAQSVTLSSATPGATIYYTTNGSNPTTASTQYTGAITVSSTSTIKAFATKTNFSDSAIATAAYTINGAVATPTFSVAAGAYGPSQSVTINTTTTGATIYYTTNGNDPTTSSSVYSSAITVSSTSTIKAFATKTNFSDSAIATAAYTINGAVATPTASPAAGIYTTAQSVTLSSATTGASIYYTLDGSSPTTGSTQYSSAIFVGVTQTIKAIAVKSAYVDSNLGSFAYTITGTVQTPTFSVSAGAYGPAQSVTLSSATPGATIYYTTNGSNPTTASTQYTGAITVSSSQTIKAFAVLNNWADSSVATAAYTINGAVATPTFSVAAGAYGPSQSVTLSTTTAGATIFYTTDGSTPTTTSSVYSSAINVASTMTVKAYATKTNYAASEVASAAYTINGAAATPTFSVGAGLYNSTQSVTLSSDTSGATIYYTVNGSTPTSTSSIYSSAISVASTQTVKAYAVKSGYSDSSVASAAYTIDTVAPTITSFASASSQNASTNTLPINFTIVFSEAINPATFTVSDISNAGSAESVTWSLSTSDNITWTVSATIASDGSVTPVLGASAVTDPAGNSSTSSTTTATNSVTYNPTPQFSLASTPPTNGSNFISRGSATSWDFYNGVTGDDSGMTYTCYYDQVINGAVASTNACSALPGTPSFNTSTGVLSWTPDATAWGPYEIKVTGTNANNASARTTFGIGVRPSYVSTNLIGDWDAQFADATKPYTSANATWKDLTSNAYDGTLNSTSYASWTGSGSYSAPYALSLNGSGYADFGSSIMSSPNRIMFSAWVAPSTSTSASDAVVLGDSANATGNGFTLRQHPSYRDVVMSLSPVGYWRLGEGSGTTATDLGSGANNGTYTGGVTLGQSGGLTNDTDTAVTFDGSSGYVTIPNNANLSLTGNISIAAWINPTTLNQYNNILFKGSWSSSGNYGLQIANNNKIRFYFIDSGNNQRYTDSSATIAANTWTHVAISHDNTTVKFYINGTLDSTVSLAFTKSSNSDDVYIGVQNGSTINCYFAGKIDDVGLFSTILSSAQVASLYQAGVRGRTADFVVGKTYQDAVMSMSPVNYWRLGESSGTVALDLGSGGNNGTYINGPTLGQTGALTGDASTSVGFDGTNDYINTTLNPSTQLGQTITVSAWVYNTNCNNYRGMGGGHIGSYIGVVFGQCVSGNWSFGWGSGSYWENGVSITAILNAWTHVVAVYKGGSYVKVYINGTLNTTQNNTPSNISHYSAFWIGRAFDQSIRYWAGKIQDVAVFNTELNATQISTLYNSGTATYGALCRSSNALNDGLWNSVAGIMPLHQNLWVKLGWGKLPRL